MTMCSAAIARPLACYSNVSKCQTRGETPQMLQLPTTSTGRQSAKNYQLIFGRNMAYARMRSFSLAVRTAATTSRNPA